VPFSEPPSRGKSLIFAGLLWMMLGGFLWGFGHLLPSPIGFYVLVGVPVTFGASVFFGGVWSAARGV